MTSTDEQVPGTQAGFAATLRDATSGAHEQAAVSPYVSALIDGRLSTEQYAQMVAQHYFIYRELEGVAAQLRTDPLAGSFVFDELTRLPHLEADLAALLGVDWATRVEAGPATEQYCERIRTVCPTWPAGFVAHHYTRYLGDLSGGVFIGAAIERVFQFAPEPGASFYRFDGVADAAGFKANYRQLLDEAPWDADEQGRVIDEVLAAYSLNTAMHHDLDRLVEP